MSSPLIVEETRADSLPICLGSENPSTMLRCILLDGTCCHHFSFAFKHALKTSREAWPGLPMLIHRFIDSNGTPKSSILIGFSIINHPFWVFSPYFWFNIHLALRLVKVEQDWFALVSCSVKAANREGGFVGKRMVRERYLTMTRLLRYGTLVPK